jgi:predicted DNA-binding transcriptional regulator AlpA
VTDLRSSIEAVGGLVTRPLAADELGFSRQYFYTLTRRPDFPKPVGMVGEIALYARSELRSWRTNYNPQRPAPPVVRPALEPGSPLIFTPGPSHQLGVLTDPEGSGFSDHIIRSGDEGRYWGKHPSLPHWHMATVEVEGVTLYVPLTRHHFYIRKTED